MKIQKKTSTLSHKEALDLITDFEKNHGSATEDKLREMQLQIVEILPAKHLDIGPKLKTLNVLSGMIIEKPTEVEAEAIRRMGKFMIYYENDGVDPKFKPETTFENTIKALDAYASRGSADHSDEEIGIFARTIKTANEMGLNKRTINKFKKTLGL